MAANLTFKGTNFASKLTVSVTWSSGTACSATTDVAGKFNCSYAIATTYFGAHTFTATDANSNTANTTYSVTPSLTASPTSGPAGTIVTFNGTGFVATCIQWYCNTQYSVTWKAASVTACYGFGSSIGSFGCSYQIPAGTPTGSFTFTASDPTPNTATAKFKVTYTPVLSVSPGSGHGGSTITFKGTSYAKNSSATVNWSEGTACNSTTDSAGSFSCSYAIPFTYFGGHVFSAVDGNGGLANATFTMVQRLTVSPTSGPAGTIVTFNGTGFVATCIQWYCNTQYPVSWMAGSVVACYGFGSSIGSFSCTYTIPAGTTTGSYTFSGSDPTPNTATAKFKVTYTPGLTVTPASGFGGTTVTFKGTSYAKNSAVTVSWSGGTACNATTSSLGSFSCTYTVPFTYVGPHPFSASDSGGGLANATFTMVQRLTVSPTSGPAGTIVTFNGTGYVATCIQWYCNTQYPVSWMAGSV
ncbi:MAG: hypothetical protein L3K09_03620, partial [Thermoplasmata archaeon]|nr:hypothetical protein [Thermoplasmata archaeon]